MAPVFEDAMRFMEEAFGTLEDQVPKPRRESLQNGFWYRYRERSAHQAIIQKLARYVSGLHAAHILLESGFLQEQGALQRTLDEFGEDIAFLTLGLTAGEWKQRHTDYLEYFYQEEFSDPEAPLESAQARPSIPRRKIRAYLTQYVTLEGSGGIDPSKASGALRFVAKGYSGYVHGASPQIMDMYGGDPPRFHLRGLLGTVRMGASASDLWNYVFRGLLAFANAALAFGDRHLFQRVLAYLSDFEEQSGTGYMASIRCAEVRRSE